MSGRALAQSAHKAGLRPRVIDLFADEDMQAVAERFVQVRPTASWHFPPEPLLQAAAGIGSDLPLVWGSGLEADPMLLARLQAGRPTVGTPAAVVAAVKDPLRFASMLEKLGVPHPPVRLAPPPDPDAWLAKAAGGSGAGHVRPARELKAKDGRYFQLRVPGRAVSALLLCGAAGVRLIGWSEQFIERGPGGRRRFIGLVAPVAPPPELCARMAADACGVAAAFGLRGLVSADFLLGRQGYHLLELNPRPGASLEVFERLAGQSLLPWHLDPDAAMPVPPPANETAVASRIVFARRRLRLGARPWPAWAADRAPAGSLVTRGTPLCTVLARAGTPAAAVAQARLRGAAIEDWLRGRGAGTPGRFIWPGLAAREETPGDVETWQEGETHG